MFERDQGPGGKPDHFLYYCFDPGCKEGILFCDAVDRYGIDVMNSKIGLVKHEAIFIVNYSFGVFLDRTRLTGPSANRADVWYLSALHLQEGH